VLLSRPCSGSLQCYPAPLAGFVGPTSKGWGGQEIYATVFVAILYGCYSRNIVVVYLFIHSFIHQLIIEIVYVVHSSLEHKLEKNKKKHTTIDQVIEGIDVYGTLATDDFDAFGEVLK